MPKSHTWRVSVPHLTEVNAKDNGIRMVTAEHSFVTNNVAVFSNDMPPVEVAPVELCGEPCKGSGKPCVRRKGHPINKKYGHMESMAPKKSEKLPTILVHGFVNCGPIEIVRIDE